MLRFFVAIDLLYSNSYKCCSYRTFTFFIIMFRSSCKFFSTISGSPKYIIEWTICNEMDCNKYIYVIIFFKVTITITITIKMYHYNKNVSLRFDKNI